jgi:pilus assembly protein CpaB
MIKSGDFVDVLFTYEGSGDDEIQGGLTLRLFDGVRVIGVNSGASANRGDRDSNVVLELTPSQVNVLTLANDRGAISLSYNPNGRGDGGLALSNTDRVTLYDILGFKGPADEPFMTEIYRGTDRSTQRYNDRGRLIETYDSSDRPRQQLSPSDPASDKTPATPVRPTDGNAGDRRVPPTALRLFLNQQSK